MQASLSTIVERFDIRRFQNPTEKVIEPIQIPTIYLERGVRIAPEAIRMPHRNHQ